MHIIINASVKMQLCSDVWCLPRYMEHSDRMLENRNNFLKSSNEQCQVRLLEAEQEKVRILFSIRKLFVINLNPQPPLTFYTVPNYTSQTKVD